MRILLQEPASVPYKLGEPDSKGVYQYVAKYDTPTEKDATATPIWYKYRPSRNCWYWTPFENYICWMPVSTIEVRKHRAGGAFLKLARQFSRSRARANFLTTPTQNIVFN